MVLNVYFHTLYNYVSSVCLSPVISEHLPAEKRDACSVGPR